MAPMRFSLPQSSDPDCAAAPWGGDDGREGTSPALTGLARVIVVVALVALGAGLGSGVTYTLHTLVHGDAPVTSPAR